MFEIRTDLAIEEKAEKQEGKQSGGVAWREWREASSQVKMTEVRILDERGAQAMGKPMGMYLTLEAKTMGKKDEDYHREISEELAGQLLRMVDHLEKKGKKRHLLVAGLGNPQVTPDALGPEVLKNLKITGEDADTVITGITPGVMAQTGMETAQIMRGIIHETEPDLVIAIDALAARSIRRLGTTIQVTDTGIHPGSGVGNHRHGLTRESLGIPVIAIGVPTVVGTAAIVHDTISVLVHTLLNSAQTRGVGTFLEELDPDEQYQLICELLEPEFGQMYVTPPDIDQTVKNISYTISEAIHLAFLGRSLQRDDVIK